MVKRGGAASLAEYISQLPPKQREALTEGIEPQTVEAMRRLIDFMVSMFGFLAKKKITPGIRQLCHIHFVLSHRLISDGGNES